MTTMRSLLPRSSRLRMLLKLLRSYSPSPSTRSLLNGSGKFPPSTPPPSPLGWRTVLNGGSLGTLSLS